LLGGRVQVRHADVGQPVRLRVGLGRIGGDSAHAALVPEDDGVRHVTHRLQLPPEKVRVELLRLLRVARVQLHPYERIRHRYAPFCAPWRGRWDGYSYKQSNDLDHPWRWRSYASTVWVSTSSVVPLARETRRLRAFPRRAGRILRLVRRHPAPPVSTGRRHPIAAARLCRAIVSRSTPGSGFGGRTGVVCRTRARTASADCSARASVLPRSTPTRDPSRFTVRPATSTYRTSCDVAWNTTLPAASWRGRPENESPPTTMMSADFPGRSEPISDSRP